MINPWRFGFDQLYWDLKHILRYTSYNFYR